MSFKSPRENRLKKISFPYVKGPLYEMKRSDFFISTQMT